MQRKCFYGFLGGALVLFMATSIRAQVVINEVLENPEGGSDAVWEYIELYGRPGMDLTGYAIGAINGGRDVNNNGIFDSSEPPPEIDEAWSLDGLSLGSDGFLVLYNDTSSGFSELIAQNLIHPNATKAGFAATHIPSTDTPGNLENDGSSTFVLVRKRFGHSIVDGESVYGAGYAFRKDVRLDVNGDGDVDFGTEVNAINTSDVAMRVDPYQMVDDISWAHDGGKEYRRNGQAEISDTPGFNPDMVSRLRYYVANPQLGHRTVGDTGGPFTIESTTSADEAFIYGDMITVLPGSNFFRYTTTVDPATGYRKSKGPTDLSATAYDGSCDPEPDDVNNPSCTPNASGVYHFTDTDTTGFKLTPGTFNDHPTNTSIKQFRYLRGDFNFDGVVNQLDQSLIQDRVGQTLDDTVPATYDPTPDFPASGDEVSYNRYLRQGVDFQFVLMMRDMDLDDGPGGTNAVAITQDDLNAFLAECETCGPPPAPADVRITEFMYDGVNKEFVEFTNVGGIAINLTGWSFDDDSRIAGTISLSAFGIVAPGESVVLAEDAAATFSTNWNLPGSVKIVGGNAAANLGRNDEINLFDASGQVVDRLTFGDQNIAGTIRTQNKSGWTCRQHLGVNDIHFWQLSAVGDQQNSFASAGGDIGSPGTYVNISCTPCATCLGDANENGTIDLSDVAAFVNCALGNTLIANCHCADMDGSGAIDGRDVGAFAQGLISNSGACH